MKLFALRDAYDPEASILAVLCCYGPERTYYIDMPENTDPWTVPFILSSFAARGQWTVDPYWSQRWVESRIVPQSRQNLGEVLRANRLQEYDTLRLLQLTEGRNSQDSCHLEPIGPSEAPAWFLERESKRVIEAVPLEGNRLLVAFRTGETRLCAIEAFAQEVQGVARILSDASLFARCEIEPGGRGVRWGSSIRIGDERLRELGQPTGLTWDDFTQIAPALLVNANEASGMLGCTRQNLHALAKRGSIAPVKSSEKSTLYLRADIRARMSDSGPTVHYASIHLPGNRNQKP